MSKTEEPNEMAKDVYLIIRYLADLKKYPESYGYFTVKQFKKDYGLNSYPLSIVYTGFVKAEREGYVNLVWRVECQKCQTPNFVQEENTQMLKTAQELEKGVIPCTYCDDGLSVGTGKSDDQLYYAFAKEYQTTNYFDSTELVKYEQSLEEMKEESFIRRLLPSWLTRKS